MTDAQQDGNIDEAVTTEEPPQYGVGPFSIREVALLGTWFVAFVVSFFPIIDLDRVWASVWTSGIQWVLTIGVPTVAVFLIVLRRLSPEGIRRVGSLGIDQFASVAFSVSAVVWLAILWDSFVSLANDAFFVSTWVVWVELILMIAGVVLTVFAPLIPPFAEDFRGRPEVPAHRNARPVRRVSPRPVVARPDRAADDDFQPYAQGAAPTAAGASYGAEQAGPYASENGVPYAAENSAYGTPVVDASQAPDAGDAVTTVIPVDEAVSVPAPAESATSVEDATPAAPTATEDTPTIAEPVQSRESFEQVENPTSTVEPAAATAPQHQAFWALVPEERDVVDEIGIPVFRIGPTAWALVIEDRGDAFVVRHEDGRIGYLHDVSGVTRG